MDEGGRYGSVQTTKHVGDRQTTCSAVKLAANLASEERPLADRRAVNGGPLVIIQDKNSTSRTNKQTNKQINIQAQHKLSRT